MKKLFAILSLTVFIAFSAGACDPTTKAAKKETTEAKSGASATASKASCCTKATAACCKNNKGAKACTAEQKAACAKAGAEHSKAEISEVKKTEEVKETKSGSN